MNKNKYEQVPIKAWHALSLDEVFRHLNSSENGLSDQEAALRLKRFGPNKILEKNGEKLLKLIWNQFRNPLVYILVIACLIAFLLGDFFDAGIIAVAVFINTAIGFFQEWKVSNIIKELKKAVNYESKVIRSGHPKQIDSHKITIGDIIILRQGDKIPADARIINLSNFKTNEAVLTGESTPVEKTIKTLDEDVPVAERSNMVFLGTFVEEGFAKVIVVNIGPFSEFGKIANLIKESGDQDITPLQKKFSVLAKQIGIFFVILSVALFIMGILEGINFLTMFVVTIAVAVAAVPESLPIALSVILATGARRILAKGGLVRKMIAAEALGSTTVITVDKTSTLTEGRMKLIKLFTAEGKEVLQNNFSEIIKKDNMVLEYLSLKLAALVSNAFVENFNDPEEDWKIYGSPVDKAIFLTLAKFGLYRSKIEREMPFLDEITFKSEHRYSAVLNKFDKEKNIISVLGAPEVVLDMSNYIDKEKMFSKIKEFAKEGLRILAIGYKFTESSKLNIDRSDLTDINFLSLLVLADPIRKEVKNVVEKAKSAGLRIIIISGDHLLTAGYVAKELGILTQDHRIIEGKNLPVELGEVVLNYDVFARVTPEDKLRIINALKEKGELVAMIGDGVNDAPALLKADIGVAVGSGTDIAKEASDLVLVNDSFSIIVEAIKQGRIILDNIKKVIVFVLSHGFSEMILISSSIIFGLPLALLPAQILWVNIIVDGLPSVALAFEKEEDVMKRKPEKKENIFNLNMKKTIAIFTIITDLVLFGVYYFLYQKTNDFDYARTVTFVGLGMTSLFYVFSVKSLREPIWRINPFSNKILNLGVLIGVVLYLLAIYNEFFRNILSTKVLSLNDWYLIVILGLFNILIIELAKFLFLNEKNR
jgi:Ca2+-transporting ATPase